MTDYQKYQLQWMIDHDCSLDNLIDELTCCQMDWAENNEYVQDIYDAWERNIGFNGMIWACHDEWEKCEKSMNIDS